MRQTVNDALDRVVLFIIVVAFGTQAMTFRGLTWLFGINRVGRAYNRLMRSKEVQELAVNAGCAEIPDKIATAVEDRCQDQ